MGCGKGWVLRCPPDSLPPQFWAAGRRECVGNGCSANQPGPNWSRALGLILWQRKGCIPATVLPCTQDLWRCGFCLVFPECQFGGLCWRRLWKGSRVRQANFQAMSHWEPRLRREHLLQGFSPCRLGSEPPAPSPRSLQPRASALLPYTFIWLKWVLLMSRSPGCLEDHQGTSKEQVCACLGGGNHKTEDTGPRSLFPGAPMWLLSAHRLCDWPTNFNGWHLFALPHKTIVLL